MANKPNQQKSQFITTFRLKPERSFAALQAKVTTGDGYELSFQNDIVWVRFEAKSDEWLTQLNISRQSLRTILAILTIQTEYPFDLEPIQWIEDKPRGKEGNVNYVLGRLGPELSVQNEPPSVTLEHIQKSEIYAHLASVNPHYRYALLDYSLSLSIPREAIVFCGRSSEWVENYFGTRDKMRNALKLPKKYLNQFFKIANETVIARHASATRPPTINEITYCVVFNRILLDRFAAITWYSQSESLPPNWSYPEGEKSPLEEFEDKNFTRIKQLKYLLENKIIDENLYWQ